VDGLTYVCRRSLADIKSAESSFNQAPQERIVVLRDLSVRSLIADPQGLQLLSKPRHLRPDLLHPLWVLSPVVPLLIQHDGVEVSPLNQADTRHPVSSDLPRCWYDFDVLISSALGGAVVGTSWSFGHVSLLWITSISSP
jgi:hypothetical protein